MKTTIHGLATLFCITVCIAVILPATVPAAEKIKPDPLAYVSPSRDFDVEHTVLDLYLDLKKQAISGSVTHTLTALKPDVKAIRLNCVALNVEEVTIDGHPAAFEYPVPGSRSTSWIESAATTQSADELVIFAREPFKRGTRFDVEIHYNGEPKVGLYFVAPEKGIPEKRHEVWSQGEGEDNRYWIPCFDYPNDKATFEARYRVDKGYYALSNGVLEGTQEVDGKVEYHWKLDTPQVTYLIMAAAGEYEIVEEMWRDVQIMYLVPPGTGEDTTRRAYGLTPDMLDFFTDYIGIDYPFKKYAQVTVQNFIYGGMENTTATVMNKRMLYDDHMAVTKTEQGLVAHELAHMWWGDMVTCAEWSHMWLNEGFATYFQGLYRGHHEGDDAFRYEVDGRYRKTIAKDEKDPRPVVVDFYNRKGSRNSANVYIKGQGVLHMLRFLIGDELFRETIRAYGEKYKYQLAETSDFAKVVRATTGENLDWFFEQWCYLSGHPELRVTEHWDDDNKRLQISIAQTQETTRLTPVFRLPMDIEITCDEKTELHRIVISKVDQDFYFSLPSKPRMVIVDKGDWTLKTMEHEKNIETLVFQAKNADTMSRVNACRALAKKRPTSEVVETLRGIMMSDEFWGLRREAAIALGQLDTREAQAAMIEGLSAEDARVRLAIAKGMGHLATNKDVDRALLELVRKDYAYQVRAEAVKSLVAMDSPQAEKACLEALKQDSNYTDEVRVAGLKGLATLKATGSIDAVRRIAEQGNRRYARHAAITTYAKLAAASDNPRDRDRAAKDLSAMLDDWYRKTRQATVAALDTLGDASVIPALEHVSLTDPVSSVRARANTAIKRLEAKQSGVASTEKMQTEIRRLSRQIESLQRDLEALRKGTAEEDKTQFSRKEGSN